MTELEKLDAKRLKLWKEWCSRRYGEPWSLEEMHRHIHNTYSLLLEYAIWSKHYKESNPVPFEPHNCWNCGKEEEEEGDLLLDDNVSHSSPEYICMDCAEELNEEAGNKEDGLL